jgi:hypothetical protein
VGLTVPFLSYWLTATIYAVFLKERNFMRIVTESCERLGNKGTIVVEADNLEAVKSLDARNLALNHAKTMGMSVPGFTGNSWTEWTDENGNRLEGDAFTTATVRKCRAHYPVQEATI